MLGIAILVATLALISQIGLLALVLKRVPTSPLRRAFTAFLVALIVWSLGSLLARLDRQHAYEWLTFSTLDSVVGLPLVIYYFVLNFTGERHSRYWMPVGIIGLIVIGLVVTTKGFLATAIFTPDGFFEVTYQHTATLPLMVFFGITYVTMSVRDLVLAFRKTSDPIRRNRLRYPLIAIALMTLGLTTNILPPLRRLPVDVTANWLSAVLLAYAVLRYRLFDVGLAFRIGLSFASVVLIIAGAYVVSLTALTQAGPSNQTLVLFALSVLGAWLLLRFVPGLRQSVQLRVDRSLFPERYDAQALLADIGRAGQQLRPISELALLVIEHLRTSMHVHYGTFFAPSPTNGEFSPLTMMGDPPGVEDIVLRPDHPLILYLQETQRGLETQQIPGLPQLKGMWDIEEQQLQALICAYFLPVTREGQLIGLFALSHRDDRGTYSLADQRLLETLAGQLAVIMENASLYEAAQERARELQRAYDELQELDRLKDEFVQNVSHELRTPLTFIKGYVELLLEGMLGPKLAEEQADALQVVQQRTDAVIRLVNDILSLQSIEEGNLRIEPVSVLEVMQLVVGSAGAEVERRGLTLKLEAGPGVHFVMGDDGRLQQVFDNLLGNAIKFSSVGGEIKVRVRTEEGWVVVEVEDKGMGIPADKLERVWDRFYQVDGSSTRRYGGTGLGLSIVRRIVEAQGGMVEVRSREGEGSCFTVCLPVMEDDVGSDVEGLDAASFI